MEYGYLPSYVLRSTLFSFEEFVEITSNESIDEEKYFEIISNKIFREALFLASPSLLEESTKWLNGDVSNKNEVQKIKSSVLKYYSRMCFRCTPFGLFAGVSVGSFSDKKSEINLEVLEGQERRTRLDMFYLAELASSLAKDPMVKEQLNYCPNPSLYAVGSKFRYVEYRFENKRRQTEIISIDNSEYLDKLINAAENGLNYLELVNILVDDEISREESKDFVDELISSQILISELEPYVSGPDFLDYIIRVLKKIPGKFLKLETLLKIKNKIKDLDELIGNKEGAYNQIIELIDQLGVDYEVNQLFQTDLLIKTSKNRLSSQIANDIMDAFNLLEKLTLYPKDNTMSRFVNSFSERYENQSIPIGVALDTELGLGYGEINQLKDSNPLIDDLVLPNRDSAGFAEFRITPIQMLLERERNKQTHTIKLEDIDTQSVYGKNPEDLSNSMTGMFEVLDIEGREFVKFSGAGGSSAVHMFGRFCHLSEEIHSMCNEIIGVENELLAESHHEAVFAEIAHLPKSRMGNVIHRPILRKYEIPYMANSILPREKQIRIKDLLLNVSRNGEMGLYSKNLGKRVIPKLATAHNYRQSDSQPIYTFLGELQSQNSRNGVGIDYAKISKGNNFLPRLVYKNILIREAAWNLNFEDIDDLLRYTQDPAQLLSNTKEFRVKWSLPEYVMLIDGDNELLIRLTCVDSILMWLNTVKKRGSFSIREYFFPRKLVLDDEGRNMAHQFNISFLRKSKK